VTLHQEKKTFRMQPPNTNVVSPHRPIIQSEHRELLKAFFDICLSSDTTINCTDETKELHDRLKEEQHNNFSITKISGAMDLIKTIFSLEDDVDFSRNVFNTKVEDVNSNDFLDFIKYSIVDFKLNTQRPGFHQPGEERTFFCEIVIPLFKAFGNTTRAITYNWCEKKIINSNYLWISSNNFNKCGVKNNLLDGIGSLKNVMSYILIESSG
jgi:hypothetical protein